MAQVASEADRERVREVVRDEVYPADAAFLEALRGDYLVATPREPGIWSAPERRVALPDPDPAPGRRSSSIPTTSTRSGWRSSRRSRRSAARSRRARASATTPRRTGRRSPPTPRTPRPVEGRADRAAPARTSSGRWRSRRGTSARCPRPPCEVKRGRGVQGERRAVRLLLPALDRRLARPGIYYANGYDLPSRKYSKLALDDLPRGGARPPLPDRARDGEPEPQHVPAPRLADASAGRMSRAGACTASGWPTRWASTATSAERFGMLDAHAWRAARLVVDTGLHALRWTAPAVDRLPARRPACRDRRGDRDRPLHRWPGQALTYMIG